MKIYVASSWRNNYQPEVVAALRAAGHAVYDFKNPSEDWHGFHWSAIQEGWESWTFEEYMQALEHDLAIKGFSSDMDAMKWADACVLVLPCGRSAHLELGWFVGQGKKTCILHHGDMLEPELMSKMCDAQFDDLKDVVDWADWLELI
jgi:hypothetical protein